MLDTSSKELLLELRNQIKVLTEEVKNIASTTPAVIKGIQGLADFLGISKSVAQKMKNDGTVPYLQYDRIVLFEPTKVLDALASQTPKYNR